MVAALPAPTERAASRRSTLCDDAVAGWRLRIWRLIVGAARSCLGQDLWGSQPNLLSQRPNMRRELLTVRRGADFRAGAQRSPANPALRRAAVRGSRAAALLAYALASVMAATSALAQGLPLIRDSEIENLLKDYSRPIFKAAGLGGQNISMRIIRHESFNAFVVDGHNVFVNTGTAGSGQDPNEVIGVIAHETGHITGGHLAQLRSRIARDQTKAIAFDRARHRPHGRRGRLGRRHGPRDRLGRWRARHGRQRNDHALAVERAPGSGIGGRPGGCCATWRRPSNRVKACSRPSSGSRSKNTSPPPTRIPSCAATRVATESALAQLRELGRQQSLCTMPGSAGAAAAPRHDARQNRRLSRSPADGLQPAIPRATIRLPARYARAIARNCSGRCVNAIGEVDALLHEKPDNPYLWELKGKPCLRWASTRGDRQPAQGPAAVGRRRTPDAGGTRPILISSEDGKVPGRGHCALLRKAILNDDGNALAAPPAGHRAEPQGPGTAGAAGSRAKPI